MNYDLLATRDENLIIGCPQAKIPKIWVWESGESQHISDKQVQDWVIGVGNRNRFLTLEKATNLDIETFYKIFRNSSTNVCLETLSDLWL